MQTLKKLRAATIARLRIHVEATLKAC